MGLNPQKGRETGHNTEEVLASGGIDPWSSLWRRLWAWNHTDLGSSPGGTCAWESHLMSWTLHPRWGTGEVTLGVARREAGRERDGHSRERAGPRTLVSASDLPTRDTYLH